MKLLLAVAAGQVCQCRSSCLTDWPRPISDLATSTSTVGNCATGWAGARLVFRAARQIGGDAAGTSAMVRTTIRAVFIRFTATLTPEP